MDYQSYEDYMRENFGYQNSENEDPYNTYYRDAMPDAMQPMNMNMMSDAMPQSMGVNEAELKEMYPDIYKIVYPMVCKVCDVNINVAITRELLDKMVEEVYNNFEVNEPQRSIDPAPEPVLRNGDVINPRAVKTDLPRETRQRDFLLNDFIRVLLLRELIDRGKRPEFRPPFRPGRPPFSPEPRPPFRLGRPPFRGYEDLY